MDRFIPIARREASDGLNRVTLKGQARSKARLRELRFRRATLCALEAAGADNRAAGNFQPQRRTFAGITGEPVDENLLAGRSKRGTSRASGRP